MNDPVSGFFGGIGKIFGGIGGALFGGGLNNGSLLVNIALTALSKKLTPNNDTPSQQASGALYTVNSTVEPRRIIYGQTLVSGLRVFASVTGPANEYLWNVVALAGHPCEDITDVWLDSTVIADGDIGDAPDTNPADYTNVTGSTDYNGFVGVQRMLGARDQTHSTWLAAADSNWTSDHDGRGVAYLVTCYKYFTPESEDDPNPWQTIPSNIRAVVKGKKVFDPREGGHDYDDESTWAWSDNPALCLRDYLTDTYLGLGVPNADIDDTLLSAAANVCDEVVSIPSSTQARYSCNGVVHCGQTPAQIIQSLLVSMQGTMIYREGKFRIYAGAYDAPAVTLTESDLAGPIKVRAMAGRKDRFNSVQATYVSPGDKYQTIEASTATNATYLSEDGETLVHYMDLPMCDNEYEAQRVAIQMLHFGRMQEIITFPAKPSAMQVACHDTVTLDIAEGRAISSTSKNALPYSEDFSGYTLGNCTLTSNATVAPDGTLSATKIVEASDTAKQHYVLKTVAKDAAAEVWTTSIFVKQAGRRYARLVGSYEGADYVNFFVDLENGGVTYGPAVVGTAEYISHSVDPVGNGWFRISLTALTDTAATTGIIVYPSSSPTNATYDGDGVSGIYIWGAQMSESREPGPYIPTTGSAYAGAGKVYRVTGTDIRQDGGVDLILREEDSTVYDDPDTGDYGTPGSPATLTFSDQDPPAPTNVSVSAYTNHVIVSWTPPLATLYTHVEVYASESNDATGAMKIGQGATGSLLYYPSTTNTHYYWTRAVNSANRKSGWSPAQTAGVPATVTSVGGAAATVTPSGVSATGSVGTVTVVADTALSLDISPSSVSKSGANGSLTTASRTATASGGATPYVSYAWAWVSGDTFTVDSPSAATTTFSGSGNNETKQGVYKCTVTDSDTNTAEDTLNVTIQWGTPD